MNSVNLSADDISRYSRQLLLDDIDDVGQGRLKYAFAVVIGLGGLGALAARYLVGAGIGKVLLVDHDTVDKSNIHLVGHSLGGIMSVMVSEFSQDSPLFKFKTVNFVVPGQGLTNLVLSSQTLGPEMSDGVKNRRIYSVVSLKL